MNWRDEYGRPATWAVSVAAVVFIMLGVVSQIAYHRWLLG